MNYSEKKNNKRKKLIKNYEYFVLFPDLFAFAASSFY